MSIRRITTALCFIYLCLIIVACDTGQGTMHGSGSMGMSSYNWGQILIGLGIGLFIGFLVGYVVSKRK